MFQVYGIGQALIPVLPPPINFQSAPTSNQTNYEIGQLVYTGTSGSYTFYIYAGAGVWELLDVSTGVLDTLTTDDSTVVVPTAGNINLKGSGSTRTVGSGSNATVELTGLTNHAVLVGAGTTTITKLTVGTDGQVLTGNSAADPSFAAIGTKSGLTAHGVVLAEGTGAFVATSAGTAGQLLQSGGAGVDPNWTSATFPTSVGASGTILLSNGTNWVASTDTYPNTSTAGALIAATAANTIGEIIDVATGQVLMSGGVGNIPAYSGSPSVSGSLTAATTVTATLGNITATNGNIVRGTAGNKDVYTSVASTTTAGANSAGTVTLTGGTATISTTSVTASSIIRLTRQSVGATGANPLGMLSVGTIVAATSFVINAWSATDATALAATDVSVIGWEIVN